MKGLSRKAVLCLSWWLAMGVLIPSAFCQTLPSFCNFVILVG